MIESTLSFRKGFKDAKLNTYGQPSVMTLIQDQLEAFNLVEEWKKGLFSPFSSNKFEEEILSGKFYPTGNGQNAGRKELQG